MTVKLTTPSIHHEYESLLFQAERGDFFNMASERPSGEAPVSKPAYISVGQDPYKTIISGDHHSGQHKTPTTN